jgi:hypothetical protein
MLGTAGGMENLHYLFEKAWEDESRTHLSYAFLKSCEDVHAFDTNPLYACLHESIYCNGGGASDWAAERVFSDDEFSKEFSAENALGPASDPHTPVLFTGEMVFPFMFDDIAALTPMKAVADRSGEEGRLAEVVRRRRVARVRGSRGVRELRRGHVRGFRFGG